MPLPQQSFGQWAVNSVKDCGSKLAATLDPTAHKLNKLIGQDIIGSRPPFRLPVEGILRIYSLAAVDLSSATQSIE